MNPLFSKLVPLSLPPTFPWGKSARFVNNGNPNHHLAETSRTLKLPYPGVEKTEKWNSDSRLFRISQNDLKEAQVSPTKVKDPSRWVHWMAKQSDSSATEIADLKLLWNYLLGETGFSDLLSYIHPDKKESLQMVVEPKNKGLVLYVFWESKETGAMGIQFHYDPEKEKPILVEITTEQSIQGEEFSKQLTNLIRDFPQIQSVQIETWSEVSFNGDYR
ncbi:hypothetical protein [Leptospira vanthielii]|uniref:Uncharacterized protein n=1 Tax=Leptospira vanthielii TaxID=293085 RepID=A0ABY2NP96_9LEPT|nr:hypothetical protein [Leptospira vanthielii]TGM56734.1 hypothetical protein EHQ95_08810 [Leptospira vanthielii]